MSLLFATAAAFIACSVAYAVTPFTSKLARRWGILDRPDPTKHKRHPAITPYLGGVAIAVGTTAGTLMLLPIRVSKLDTPRQLVLGLALAGTLGLIGLLDDMRPLPRVVRLAAQLAGASAAWTVGFQVQAFDSELVNLGITILWIVGITNAFNLLDNMDGLSAGMSAVSALSFMVLGVLGDLWALSVISAALSGAAFGFLVHNRHPARVFMGDAGSVFIGFVLALIGLEIRFDNLEQVTFLVPVVVLGVPILDTSIVVISRVARGMSPFQGGRDHISHRLVQLGLPIQAVVGLLYWAGLCLGWLGLVISRSNVQVGWMLLGFVGALGVFFGLILLRVPISASPPRGEMHDPDELHIRSSELSRDHA
jgi:UDP-GlcNAc:undecaprenyl-phosphate/decaprenyl-phosphate GlcNAc-1-phosphate transferase